LSINAQFEAQKSQIKSLRTWIFQKRVILLLSTIMILGIFLRFYDLGNESLWLDEASSIQESNLGLTEIPNSTNQPPLYFLILHQWINLFGSSEIALRSLSALFGIFSLFITYLVSQQLFTKKIALVSVLISAISTFQIIYSQEARGYSLMLLLALLSFYFFLKILYKGKLYNYLGYLLASTLLAYTHIYGIFILISQFVIAILVFRHTIQLKIKYTITLFILIIFLLPLLWLMSQSTHSLVNNGFWIPKPTLVTVMRSLGAFSGYGFAAYVLFIIFGFLAVIVIIGILQPYVATNRIFPYLHKKVNLQIISESNESVIILLIWMIVPFLIAFLESQVMTPIYATRYLIGTSPALYILAAKGLDKFNNKRLFIALIALIVIFSSLGLRSYYVNDQKEQWRQAAEYIESNAQKDDVILIYQGYSLTPFNYYYHGNLQEVKASGFESIPNSITSIKQNNNSHGRIWLIIAQTVYVTQINEYINKWRLNDFVLSENHYIGIEIVLLGTG
jgi:mannosyltransferase